MPGVVLASHTTCTAQTSYISEQSEQFSPCPNSATIQHGYQRLVVDKAHATDVIGWRICYCSLCDAVTSGKG